MKGLTKLILSPTFRIKCYHSQYPKVLPLKYNRTKQLAEVAEKLNLDAYPMDVSQKELLGFH